MDLPKIIVDFKEVDADGMVAGSAQNIEDAPDGYIPKIGDRLKAADGKMRCVVEVIDISGEQNEITMALHMDTWRTQPVESL